MLYLYVIQIEGIRCVVCGGQGGAPWSCGGQGAAPWSCGGYPAMDGGGGHGFGSHPDPSLVWSIGRCGMFEPIIIPASACASMTWLCAFSFLHDCRWKASRTRSWRIMAMSIHCYHCQRHCSRGSSLFALASLREHRSRSPRSDYGDAQCCSPS
jgi:hypothetical protein